MRFDLEVFVLECHVDPGPECGVELECIG
jgi:hypothetical protein